VPFSVTVFGVKVFLPALLGSAVFGAVMAILLGLMDQIGQLNEGGPSNRRSPQQKIQIRSTASAEQLESALRETLARLSARIDPRTPQDGVILAQTAMSVRSFGEWIAITVRAVEEGHVVTLSSRPRVASTVVDYGKGRRNVNELARAIAALDEQG
jgi:hypothetical protein